jgi:hypothetical protein
MPIGLYYEARLPHQLFTGIRLFYNWRKLTCVDLLKESGKRFVYSGLDACFAGGTFKLFCDLLA